METGVGPHPLRLFICLMPLCLALLLGPGRPGTAEEGEETLGAWDAKIQEAGELGCWEKESYGETGVGIGV